MPALLRLGVLAYVSKDNHGKHIIHCGGDYKSYLQIGVLKKS